MQCLCSLLPHLKWECLGTASSHCQATKHTPVLPACPVAFLLIQARDFYRLQAGAYRVILTHFSQRYPKIPVLGDSRSETTCIAFDLMTVNLAGQSPLCPLGPQNAAVRSVPQRIPVQLMTRLCLAPCSRVSLTPSVALSLSLI